jgi:NitT/TauT family transport system permease protein
MEEIAARRPAPPDLAAPDLAALSDATSMAVPEAVAAMPRGERRALWSWKRYLPFVVIAVAWEIASYFSPPYLFPGLGLIVQDIWAILTTWDLLYEGLVTWARLLGAIAVSLLLGIPIGLFMGMSSSIDEFVRPVVKFIMGVPALNWVIIVIIWFSNVELRIGFVLVMLCTPITIFCVYDGVRSMDRKLTDMVLSFGASRLQFIHLLLWPYIKAFAFTSLKLNVGNAIRTVIVAEMVGAPVGIGKELDLAKNVFDLGMVLAWTLIMVGMLMLMTHGIERAERLTLRWRADARGRA